MEKLITPITPRCPHIENLKNSQTFISTAKNQQYCNTIWYKVEFTHQSHSFTPNCCGQGALTLGKLENLSSSHFNKVTFVSDISALQNWVAMAAVEFLSCFYLNPDVCCLEIIMVLQLLLSCLYLKFDQRKLHFELINSSSPPLTERIWNWEQQQSCLRHIVSVPLCISILEFYKNSNKVNNLMWIRFPIIFPVLRGK